MTYLLLLVAVALAVSSATAASLPETPERRENTIVLEVAPTGHQDDHGMGKSNPDTQDGEPFEIIVPVARNFSSLEELFQILREDSPKEPRASTGTPPSYVKGTERNASDYLIFFTDGVGKSGST